jgi:hypothetical protein
MNLTICSSTRICCRGGRRRWRGRVVAYTAEQSLKGHSHETLQPPHLHNNPLLSGRMGWRGRVVAYKTEQSLKGHSHETLNPLRLHMNPQLGRPEGVEGAGSSLHNRTVFKGTFSRDLEPSASAPRIHSWGPWRRSRGVIQYLKGKKATICL